MGEMMILSKFCIQRANGSMWCGGLSPTGHFDSLGLAEASIFDPCPECLEVAREWTEVVVTVVVFGDGKCFASSGYGDVSGEEDAWAAASEESRGHDDAHRIVRIDARIPRPDVLVIEVVAGVLPAS